MSDEADPIEGESENGRMVVLDFPFHAGPAGLRSIGDVVEVAYVGRRPLRLPVEGMIDGDRYIATAGRSATVSRMWVVTAEPVAEPAEDNG